MKIDRRGGNLRGIGTRGWQALLLSCTALAAISATSAVAQDAETSASGTQLQTIVIEGSGNGAGDDDARTIVAKQTTGAGKMPTNILETPASVSVITSKEIQQRGAQDVEQVLQYTAGVATDFYGSDDRFDYFKIRGFDAYIYRDGLLLGDPFGSMREEPYAYERVEVLKGANSTGFGVSDPGGSVNFVTKTPKSARFGEAYITGGSYGRAETGVDFGDNITDDDTLSYRITGKVRRADAEYDHSQDDENFFMGGLTWRPTDMTNLTVVYDHLDKDGVPGGGGHPVGSDFARSRFFGEPDYNYRDVDRDSLSVMFDHDFGNGLVFGSNARYSDTKSNFGYAYVAGTSVLGPTYVDRDYFGNESTGENFIIDARLQYDASFENIDSRTLVGLEYNDNHTTSSSYYGDAPDIDWSNPIYTGAPASVPMNASTTNDNKTTALYMQQELTFSDRLTATLGLRNDWLDINQTNNMNGSIADADFSEFTKRAALSYKLTDEVVTYVSYAESAVPASVSVDPERGKQWELGIKYQPSEFPALFTAAVYDLTKENITRNVGAPPVPTAVGEVQARGIDLEAKAELTNNLSLTAAYSYVDTEIVENGNSGNEGNRLAMVPEHLASAWLNYTWLGNGVRGDMTFGLGARYMGSYYFSDANTVKSDSAIVFDAAYSYKIRENTSFEVNVTNLFDEKHVANGGFGADFYNPGRAIYATLRQTW
jgi:TonB-dependent siderophore receptor